MTVGVREARAAATNTYRVARNLQVRLQQIQGLQDPNLSSEGLQKARSDRRVAVLAAARARIDHFLATAKDGRDFAQSRLEEHRPKIDLNDVAHLTRTAQTWDMIVKPMRDAGKNWSEIAQVADSETLAALSRFAEQTIRLEDPHGADVILQNLAAAVDQRIGDTHPDESVRQLFTEAREAQAALTATASMSAALERVRDTAGVTSALIFGQRSLHPLGLLPAEAPSTGDQQDRMLAALQGGLSAAHATIQAGIPTTAEAAHDVAHSALPAA